MPNKKLVLFFTFFIQAALLSVCQNISQQSNCPLSFQCGTITNAGYPFWGGADRPLSCGYPGFELDCPRHRDVPLLTISSSTYRVLGIDFSARTLRVARQDFWNTTCPTTSPIHSTTLNPYIFQFPPNSDYENVTLYYGCFNNNSAPQPPNQFTCDGDGDRTFNLFRTGSGSSVGPGTGIMCNNSISIPVNQTAARALETNSSINVLQDALANGFTVTWLVDNNSSVCDSCRGSGGTCGCDESVCYMDSGGNVAVWGVCSVDFQANTSQGLPPVEAPSPFTSDSPSPLSSDGPSPLSSNGPPHSSPRGYGGSSSDPEQWKLVVLVLGVTGAGLFIIISIFCRIRRGRTRGSHNNVGNLNVEQFLLQHGSLALKRYKYSEIKKMTKSLSDKLGQGGYGSVYKGKLPDGSFVAVKVLTDTGSNNGEDFINEVASISRTSHVNIVNLLGFCFDSKHRALVYEYMPNKSLDKYIGGSRSGSDHLDIEILYTIAVGVAKGLEYLHTGCNTRIVHFDIKPQNILLDEDFCPKISDFGLAKLCKKKQSLLSVMGTRGTVGYIAPEVFSRNFGGVSHKSDVYSYGMMVLEMAGASTIGVDLTNTHSSENYFPDKIYERVVDITRRLDGFGIEEEEETARKMLLVGFWCIQTNPTERPSISKVVEMLEGSVESVQIPPKPVLFTPTLPVLGEVSSSFSSYVDETQPPSAADQGIIIET